MSGLNSINTTASAKYSRGKLAKIIYAITLILRSRKQLTGAHV